MDPNCICNSTRPNLHKLSETDLREIIYQWDSQWLKEPRNRDELVSKIFELWANKELVGIDSKPLECLICCDILTNGNNMTFECGHKFHSICIVKHLLVFTSSSYKDFLEDKEKNNMNLDYNCPQCKKQIDSIYFGKNDKIN